MVETASSMVPLGTQMPSFSLHDSAGGLWAPREGSAGTLVVFMCNHCPFVVHVAKTLVDIQVLCTSNNIEMIGINSNDVAAYPDDAPEKMIQSAEQYGWEFPYLIDETQEVAKSFQATCTPDVYLYDSQGKLYYRGQFDKSRPSQGESNGENLVQAIESLILGKAPPSEQAPSIGCNIKWK